MQQPEDDFFHQIALSFAEGIGPKMANILIAEFGTAKAVLAAPIKQLIQVGNMGEVRAKALKDPSIMTAAEKECKYIEIKNIKVLSQSHPDFSQRLLNCSDAPQLLFCKGNVNLNAAKTIAIIGTRSNTEYGQRLTNDLVDGLVKVEDLCIISGLAYGIDTIAHKASLKNNIPTIGVLGHGLHTIYPVANKKLAEEMQENGALLSEFTTSQKVERGNFPARNRIVAGLTDITIVVESDIKGGALITAYIANSYNREVAAFPGRAYDSKSSGCNMLIRKNLASLITNADDLLELMGWEKVKKNVVVQKQLMLNLSEEEKILIDILQQKDNTHSDELQIRSGMNSSALASCLLMLEMQGLIKTLPGKLYRMN